MARDFDVSIDFAKFADALEDAAEAIADGAKLGMRDALDAWVRESVDIAPLDKGTLRRGIKAGDVERVGDTLEGSVSATAIERSRSGKRFNYAYYIHEKGAGGRKLRHPGTEKKYLDVALERNEDAWLKDIEREIEDELKRKGW